MFKAYYQNQTCCETGTESYGSNNGETSQNVHALLLMRRRSSYWESKDHIQQSILY